MAGARLYGGPDFSRSCGAQQSHTSAGTALAAALVAASPKADLDASNRDRLWLPAKAACTSSTQATLRDNAYPRAPGFTGSADDVPTQWLAAPTVPTPAEPRRELRRPSTGRPGPPALRAAQTDPGVGRPAGMRTPRAVRAWQSADEALVAEVHCKPPGAGPDIAMAEDAGWAPNRQFLPEELRYNPITHEVEVYVNRDGNVQKCEPSAHEYREMVRRLEAAPPKKGRRKGLSEFVDLCCAGRTRPNPHVKVAYEHNRKVFQKQRGPCTHMYDMAKGYPGNPRVFEPDPRISMPAGQIPRPWTPTPTPVRPPSAPPVQGGNRARRPQSARTSGARPQPQTIAAPPSALVAGS
ncbi:DnaJ-1 [Symbiodinium sp. CCMP2456]|nr:DnaJ-1 [Symbiodinium sp. CCMP2456]